MSQPTDIVPLIDLSSLDAPGEAGLREAAARIGAACREIGFFYVAGHGVSPELVAAAFAASRQLFALDRAAKANVSIALSPHNRGYVGLLGEALDPTKPPDLKEAFNIGFDLALDDPEVIAGKPFRGVNLWPALPGFRETTLAYFGAMHRLGRRVHRAFAVDLGLTPGWFDDKLDRPMATLRLLHYPAATAAEPGQLGAGEHTDYGNVTLLATDAVGGLEVRARSGEWIAAPMIPGAFICNIGDCLMRWTNDVYVSTPHRVVAPPGRERYSIAFFLDPNPEAEVACLPSCITPERPARYVPIQAGDFLRARLAPTYAHRASV